MMEFAKKAAKDQQRQQADGGGNPSQDRRPQCDDSPQEDTPGTMTAKVQVGGGLLPWPEPGKTAGAEGQYQSGREQRRAASLLDSSVLDGRFRMIG